MTVGKHHYDVYWMDPATGETMKEKDQWKYRADPNKPKSKTKRVERSVLDDDEFEPTIFEATPPDAVHDWVLLLSRDGKKEGMAKSYKFESWHLPLQEAERSLDKAPFELSLPKLDDVLPIGQPVKYAIRLKRQTGGTRRMTYHRHGGAGAGRPGLPRGGQRTGGRADAAAAALPPPGLASSACASPP